MIQFPIDPFLDQPVYIPEVSNHSPLIQIRRRQFNFHFAIVSVQVLALPGIMKEPVPVTKMNDFDDGENGFPLLVRNFLQPP